MDRWYKIVLNNLQRSPNSYTTTVINRIVNNTVISLLGQIVTWISTLLLTIAYGRFLGDVKFGELYFAITFVTLIGFPLGNGINQQITREVAQDPDKALQCLSSVLLIKVVLWLFLYCFILCISWLLGYSQEERLLVAICGFILLSSSITSTFASIHYAFEQVMIPVVGSVLEKGLSSLVGILLLLHGADVKVIAYVLLGGSIVSGIWQAIWFYRLVKFRFVVDLALIHQLSFTSIPFLVYGLLGAIYYRVDTVMLSLMTNAADVGLYGASYRLFDSLFFLPNIVIMNIMYPVFSKFSVTSETNLKLVIEKSINFLLFFSIPIAIILIGLAPNIIEFLYHRTVFLRSIPVLQWLAIGLIFLYINSVLSSVLICIKQEKKLVIMASCALIFNVGLNLVIIPSYQQVGAAIVTSLTELLLLSISLFIIPKQLLPLGSLNVGGKAILASLPMVLVILSMHMLNIFVILPISMMVYLGTAMLVGTIPREDIKKLYRSMLK